MSTPTETKQWIVAHRPAEHAVLSGSNATFKQVTTPLPQLKSNQVLVEVQYFSNDPAQRAWLSPKIDPERLYTKPVVEGDVMAAFGMGKVIASTAGNFKQGQMVISSVGWSQYAVLDAAACRPVPEVPGIAVTHFLGALGSTGLTAWAGLVETAEATKDDTVVVSGAAGATGSMVVQIAKHMIGCKKVIGLAGSPDKCRWVESLGADVCINYKDKDWRDQLKKATTPFVEVYFDNVGGEILDFMIGRMKTHGRIAACGAVASYNTEEGMGQTLKNYMDIISMRIQLRGFLVLDFLGKAPEVVGKFVEALKQGKLKVDDAAETVVPTEFEKIPNTWIKLFEGGNQGKLITKLI